MTQYTISVTTEDQEEIEQFIKGRDAHAALYDISQEIFRPVRKHGYADPRLEAMAEGNEALIEKLEAMFWRIVNDKGLDIF